MEGHLFGFGKKIIRIAIECHLADSNHRHQFLGNELGRIQKIEFELLFVLLLHNLHPELPFRVLPRLDRLPQITPVKIGIQAGNFLRLIPQE